MQTDTDPTPAHGAPRPNGRCYKCDNPATVTIQTDITRGFLTGDYCDPHSIEHCGINPAHASAIGWMAPCRIRNTAGTFRVERYSPRK